MCSTAIIKQLKKRITRRNLFNVIGASGYMTSRRMGPSLIFEL
jgi:hypothetical protein